MNPESPSPDRPRPRVSDRAIDEMVMRDEADGKSQTIHVVVGAARPVLNLLDAMLDLRDSRREVAELRAALQEIEANGWCPCVLLARKALGGKP